MLGWLGVTLLNPADTHYSHGLRAFNQLTFHYFSYSEEINAFAFLVSSGSNIAKLLGLVVLSISKYVRIIRGYGNYHLNSLHGSDDSAIS